MISQVKVRKVLNSRANFTLEVELLGEDFRALASVPEGKSKGKFEAIYLPIDRAVEKAREIGERLIGVRPRFKEVDKILLELDGTERKERLGANVILAFSIASAKAQAQLEGKELFEIFGGAGMPRPCFNILNGGKHAGNELSIQEFMVCPSYRKISRNVEAGVSIYRELRELLLEMYGKTAINVGDEGGFAPPLKKTRDALDLLVKAIERSGYEASIALDCAASEFFKNGKYFIDGAYLSPEELLNFYFELLEEYPIFSIEDPFHQEAFELFSSLVGEVQVVGDDLLVTNVRRLKMALERRSVSCVLVKPNQIGSLSETLEFIRVARGNGLQVMVSHRSGETEDTFIADLAVGVSSEYVKFGAPARGERTCKYNRLLRIGEILA